MVREREKCEGVCVCSKLSSPCVGRWAGGFVCTCARALASEQDSVLKKVYALDESILGINSEARKTHTHKPTRLMSFFIHKSVLFKTD